MKGKAIMTVGAVLAVLGLAFCAVLVSMNMAATTPPYDPEAGSEDVGDDGFPKINWKKWKEKNEDIVGWITVPGTKVDFPIVKAPKSDPEYYLRRDIYGNWNINGTIYLDAHSDGGLLTSSNAVLFGHHMDYGNMFAQLAQYSDKKWAKKHRKVLVQTPEHKVVYRVGASDIINAWSTMKHTEFASTSEFEKWRDGAYGESDMKLADKLGSDRILSLVTCSYHYWGNERTVTYCQPYKVDGERASFDELPKLLGKTAPEKADEAAESARSVKAVEDAIDRIGEVGLTSHTAIETARDMYNMLSASEKESVSNSAALDAAQSRFDELLEQAQDKEEEEKERAAESEKETEAGGEVVGE